MLASGFSFCDDCRRLIESFLSAKNVCSCILFCLLCFISLDLISDVAFLDFVRSAMTSLKECRSSFGMETICIAYEMV